MKKVKKQAKKSKVKNDELKNVMGALGFLGSHKGMFSGMKMGLGVGDKAIILGKGVNMKGHEPVSKYAQLSDGSKITMTGPNKGLIVR